MTTKKNRKIRNTKKKNINHKDDILTNLKRFIMSRKLKKAKAKAKTLSNNRLNMSGGVDITTIQNAKQAVLYKETMAADAKKQATALRNKARTARALVTDNLTPDKRAILDLQAKTAESEAEQKDKIANMKEEEALVARLELNALELDQEASTEKLKLMNVNRETVVTTDDQNDRATRASELTTTWNNAKTKADEARRQADVAATKLIETKAKANNEETTITRAVPNISEISKITIDQAKTALAYAETQKKRAVDNVAKMESIAETERSSLKTGQAFQGNKPELITRLQEKLSQAEENLKQAKEKEQLANENFSSATATYIAKDKMEKDNEAKRIARLEANAIREAKITRGEDKEKRGTIETRDIIMARYKERKKAEQAAAEKVAAEAKIQAAQQTAQQAAEQAVEEAEKALKLADERLSIAKKAESESYTKLGVAEKREKGGLSHIADVPEAKAFLEANIEKVRAIMDTRAAAMAILNAAKATARAINDDMKKKAAELTVTANEQMTIAQTREKQAVMMEKKAEGVRPALLEKEKEKASKAASIKAYKLGAQTASKADQMDGIIQNKDRVDGANSEARNIEINNTTAAEAAAAEAAAEEAAAAEAAAAEAAAAEAAAAEAAAAEAEAQRAIDEAAAAEATAAEAAEATAAEAQLVAAEAAAAEAAAAEAAAAEAKAAAEAATAAVPEQPISNDQKIKNTIGAIILALALTISESMPKTKIGNSSGKKYSKEEIEKMQEEYNELTKKIESTFTPPRIENEKKFNEIKTKSGNKKSKKMELIAVLNNLLTNKRTIEEFEKPDLEKSDKKNMAGGGGCSIYDTDPECTLGSNFYNAKAKEIEKHRRTINEIMSYLLEEKINMKYEWVAIKGIGGKDKDLYKGKVGIISKLNNNNTEDVDIKGKWAFEVWIPDKGGLTTLVRPDDNGLKKKLQVKNSKQEIIDKFLTKNISIYEVQFLDKQYDHTNDINFQPVIDGENLEPISSLKKNFLVKNYNTITNAINPTDLAQGTYTTAEGLTTALTTRGLREDLKELIKNVIETKFTKDKAVALLTRKINFYNKKKSIKDILISKISYIFASGETRLNLFNRSNVKKNFKEDEEAQNDGEEAQNDGEEAQQGGEEGDYIKEGGGGYGTRNFDKDDAKNFIKFILESLTALHYQNIPETTKNLLFSNYLKALLKITPSELNKLLLDINNISELSNNVIEHFIGRLTNNQKSVSDQATTPAAKISKLNFALKSNVQAFTRSIVDITLHSEQMVGSEEKVEEYLDNEYNKAMKLPTGEDQGRISNFELKSALNSILGPNINTIKGYKEKIQKIDSHIDSINAKNITTKLRDFNTVFSLGKLENGTIIYNLPDKISGNLKAQETEKTKEATLEASSKEKLNQAVELLKEMLASSKDTDTTTQKQKLQQFLTSLNPKDEE